MQATKNKTKRVSRSVTAKARELLAFAREKAAHVRDWVELDNAIFGAGGKANELFPAEPERTMFTRTKESKKIYAIFDELPAPPVKELGDISPTANGVINVRLPRSVYAALLAEAQAEGVSLDQLCLSKLVAQLREVV